MVIKDGDEFRVKYPFVSCVYSGYDERGEFQEDSWRPGCKSVLMPDCDTAWFANAEGQMVITVVGVFKPGKFPERVFYTRKWIDPDGKEFGNGKLRIATTPTFKKRIMGYYHQYEISDSIED